MIERKGNIFDTEATYIGHGVNVYGVMGAGIARQFKQRFPNNFDKYEEACSIVSSEPLRPGGYLVVKDTDKITGREHYVVNFASQEKPGPDADYQWLFSSLLSFAKKASMPWMVNKFRNLVAIPEIGCGIGGLKWSSVKAVIEVVEEITGMEFEVWHYE